MKNNQENKVMETEDIEVDLDNVGENVTGGAPQAAWRIRLEDYHKVIDQAAEKTVNTVMRDGSQVLVPTSSLTERKIVTIIRDNEDENT